MEARLLAALLMEALSLKSDVLRLSHGLAAIHLSNQLQPQWGLLGSMNVGCWDFEEFFHIFCIYAVQGQFKVEV